MLVFPLFVSWRARTTAKFVIGSNVVSPGLETRSVVALSSPTVTPFGKRPVIFAAPMMSAGWSGSSLSYEPASCGVRPMRRL